MQAVNHTSPSWFRRIMLVPASPVTLLEAAIDAELHPFQLWRPPVYVGFDPSTLC
jgi:hypothetical protein